MNEFEKLNLKKITGIKIEDLILDPNNPRFCKHPSDMTPEERYEDPEVQEQTFILMGAKKFEINELESSIKTKGFVNVDNIFVKKIKTKYLVVEGNRRITAIKTLLNKHEQGKPINILPEDIKSTLTKFDCIDLTDNTNNEIDFVLGLRHHGSIKAWDFLPSAFNLFKRYMIEYCNEKGVDNKPEEFEYDSKNTKAIARLNSIKPSEVRDKLRAYRVYLQLNEAANDDELESKFSIIHDSIAKPALRKLFKFNETYCTFEDEGLELFINLVCGTEDNSPVITAASAGDSNLRDLAYVVSKGSDEDFRQIIEERKDASDVAADVKSQIQERTLLKSLTRALDELKKIKISNEFEELAEKEKESVEEIYDIIMKIKKLSGSS